MVIALLLQKYIYLEMSFITLPPKILLPRFFKSSGVQERWC